MNRLVPDLDTIFGSFSHPSICANKVHRIKNPNSAMQLWFGAPRSRAENSETVTADSILLKILRITVTLEIDSLF